MSLLICLALVVTIGVGAIFHQTGVAKTYQKAVLTCTAEPQSGPGYAGFFVHTHNADCYDEHGNLACTLEEIEAHVHDESCYTTARELVCTVPESEGHVHTEECYSSVRGELTCGQEESEPILDEEGNILEEGHVHTNDCYIWTQELSCGLQEGDGAHHHDEACYQDVTRLTCDKPEVILHVHTDECYLHNEAGSLYVDEYGYARLICGLLETTEHIHGPECFTVYELDDGEPEESEEDKEPASEASQENGTADTADGADRTDKSEEEDADEQNPSDTEEKSEAETVEEPVGVSMPAQSFTGGTADVTVNVVAPEGAFPAGTTMQVMAVEVDDETMNSVEKTVGGRVTTVQAVDITFYDAEGNKVEPQTAIQVSMKSAVVSESENVSLIHKPDAEETDDAEAAAPALEVVEAAIVEQNDSAVPSDEITFESDAFSVYMLVGSETIETQYITTGGETYNITLTYSPEAGIPDGATLQVSEILAPVTDAQDEEVPSEYSDYVSKAEEALKETEKVVFARFFDITIVKDGQEIQPAEPVSVQIQLAQLPQELANDDAQIVHFGTEETEILDTETSTAGVSFETGSFSVYGVIYTVDFHWEVNGKIYDFSIPGGGFVSLEHLVEVLGIGAGDTNAPEDAEDAQETSAAYDEAIKLNGTEVCEATKKFVADIASVEFSSPELVWAGRVNDAATVGGLKETNGLEVEYSAELTEEQIAEINAQTLEAGDWALISVHPFVSEESLTVTMKNGEVFVIRVTDGQISTNVLTADGKTYKITVTFDDDAEIPAGTKLVAEEIEPGTDEYLQHLGEAWTEVNKEYLEKEERPRTDDSGLEDDNVDEDIHPVNIDHVRFFDIRLEMNGEEVEPKAPVKVEIQYVDGFPVSETENPVTGVAHFREKDIELIEEVEIEKDLEGNLTGFLYMQESFSDIGTYVGQETTDDPAASVAGRIAYPKLSAMLGASSGSLKEELGEPIASKSLKDNEDGTYTLSLSVTGAAKKMDEQPKANVLFVMDRSSSMNNNYIYLPYSGEHQSKITYYGTNDGKNYFALNYSNGSYTYKSGNRTYNYNETVYTRISRLKAEQDAMSILFEDLLENNKDGNGNYTKDTVEISVISFADDRGKMNEGTEYPRSGSVNGWTSSDYDGLMTVVNNTSTPKGTNWQDALKYAKEVADAKKTAQPDEPVFVIFLTDGEPTAVYGESGGAKHYIGDNGDVHDGGFIAAYLPARPDAKAIVDAGYGFYSIFTFNPGEDQIRYLKRLVHYAYTGYDGSETTSGNFSYLDSSQYVRQYFYNADNPENLASAFDDILSAITTTIAHGNVSIVDGLTTDAMTSTLIDGKANGFTYKVTDENNNVLYTVTATGDTNNPSVTFKINGTTYSGSQVVQKENSSGKKYYSVTVDGKEYKMALADFTATGEGDAETKELKWDLSPIGTLVDKCTYSIDFVVWPNQEAYDYVAALNNGLMEWNETTQIPVYDEAGKLIYYKNGVENYPSIVWDPETKIYKVLTNTKQELEYSIISTTNGVETTEGPYTVELETPDPMRLTKTASQIEKQWNVERDPGILAQLLYDLDGSSTEYKINFDILQDDDGTTTDDDAKNTYTTVTLGWDDTANGGAGAYVWAPGSVQTVTYNGHPVSVGTRWASNFSIATGLMLSTERMNALGLDTTAYPSGTYEGTTYYILETGHDYTIKEPTLTYQFDFDAPVYHPMLVDGKLRSVNLSVKGMNASITDMTDAQVELSALKVENTLRGYINLDKVVLDEDEHNVVSEDSTKFTYTIELNNTTNPGPFTVEGSHVPWYGISGLFYHDTESHYYQARATTTGQLSLTDESNNTYTASCEGDFDQNSVGPISVTFLEGPRKGTRIQLYGNQMDHRNDNYVSAKIKINQHQTLNISNVPVGTTYTITESDQSGYPFVKIVKEIKLTPEANAESSETYNSSTTITDTIVANRDNHITYYNKKLVTDITIQKTDADGKGLAGAVFQLKKVGNDGHSESPATEIGSVGGLGIVKKEIDGKEKEFQSAFETTGEIQTITGLPDGKYRLYEVYVPAGYVNTYKYIQFEIINREMKNVTTDTGDTSKLDTTANGIDLKIANVAGTALPNTGGEGSLLFSVVGTILILSSTLLILAKRKREEPPPVR